MAHGVGLLRFAFAIVSGTIEFVGRAAAQAIAGAPEIGGARLVGDIAQHLANLAFLDFPKGLSAELEIISLVID